MKTARIGGVTVHDLTMPETLERVDSLVRAGRPSYIVTPNVDHIVRFEKDADFARAYREATLVLADGGPLLLAARWLGTPVRQKVSGSDLMPELCRQAAAKGHRIYFFGGRPGAADATRVRLEREYPAIRIVGVDCPPMGFEKDPEQNAAAIRRIREARPDILFLGLGTPKQEVWMQRHAAETGVPVSIGIGATFEFMSGVVKRAPVWMQRASLEWLWRLILEPKRLWRRYLVDDPEFFRIVWKQKFSKRS